ncbi:MAG: mechanosensitive ion channel family protein [Hadesarchaea archaeon]|nr:mechanosensitive ion channel family protein [Hadesarchaea archaeon]
MTLEEIWRVLDPILIFAVTLVCGYVLRVVLSVYVARLARKTKTELDDIILGAIKTPIVLIFLILGTSFALTRVPFYQDMIEQYLPIISYVLIVLIATMAAVRTITRILRHYGVTRPNLKSLVPILSKTVNAIVYFIAFILILNGLGIDVTALVAGLGIGGIAIAFALQETLSQFFAGVYLMTDKPFKVGDYIKIETGQEGYVVDIGWRSTKIRELPNNIITVPNSKLAGSIVIDYYQPAPEMSVLVQVGVSYDSDLEKVERVTIEVAKEIMKKVKGGVPEFEPFIRYHTFSDFSINFTVILRAREYTDRYLVTHEFIKALHKRYQEEGIVIPFPIRTVYLERGKN